MKTQTLYLEKNLKALYEKDGKMYCLIDVLSRDSADEEWERWADTLNDKDIETYYKNLNEMEKSIRELL